MPSLQYDRHALHCVSGSVSNNSNSSTLPTSLIICFVVALNGLWALFCCRSSWRACRCGWFSIFLTNSRTREFLGLFHNRNVAIQVFGNQCPPRSALIARYLARDLRHGWQRVAPLYHLYQFLHEKNVFRSPENGTFIFHLTRSLGRTRQRVVPFYHDLGLELVGLIGNFWIVEQLVHLVVEQLLNSILSSSHVSRRSLAEAEVDAYTFSYMTSPVSILTTFGIQQAGSVFVKNDSVRSSLIELQILFFRARLMSTQYTVFWCFFHALCMYCAWRGAFKSIVIRILVVFVHGIHRQKGILSVCCSNFDLPVLIPNWWWNVNWWLHIRHDKCTGRNCSE